jgi:hypothetical protein
MGSAITAKGKPDAAFIGVNLQYDDGDFLEIRNDLTEVGEVVAPVHISVSGATTPPCGLEGQRRVCAP